MTTIDSEAVRKAQRRAYDIARRPMYRERKKELRKGWKETAKAATRNWKSDPVNWHSVLYANARCRAKKRGIVFALMKADVVIPTHCPVLGIKLAMGTGNSFTARDCAPSLDRLDNSQGYVPGNVRVISWRANRLKSDATANELSRVLAYMRGEIPSQP